MANGMKPQQPKVQAKAGAFTAKALAKLGSNQQKLGQAIGEIVAANFDDQNVTDDDKRVKIVDLIIKRIKTEVLEGETFGTFSSDQLEALNQLISQAVSESGGRLSEESKALITESIVSEFQNADSAGLDIDTMRGLLQEEFTQLSEDVAEDLEDSVPKPATDSGISAKIDNLTDIANQQLSKLDKIVEAPIMKGGFFANIFKNPFKGLFDKINGKFTDLNNGLKNQLGKIGGFVTAPFKKLGEGLKAGFGKLGGLVSKPFKALGDKLGSLKKSIGGMFTSPFKKLGSLFNKTPKEKKAEKKRESIFDELDKLLKKFKKWAANITTMILDFITNNVIPIMKAIGRGIGELIAAIFKVPIVALITAVILGTMVLLAITFFMLVDWLKNGVWPKIEQFLDAMEPEDIKTMMHGIANIVDVIGSALGYVMMPLRVISRVINVILGIMDKVMKPLIEGIATLLTKAMDIIFKVLGKIFDFISAVIGPILDGIAAVLVPVIKIVSAIWKAVGKLFEMLIPVVEAVLGKIVETIGKVFEALMPIVDIIFDVIVGTVQAIATGIKWVVDAIKWTMGFLKNIGSFIWKFIKGGIKKIFNIGKALSGWAREKMAPLADWSIWGYHPFGFLKGSKEKQKTDGTEEEGDEEESSSDEEKSSLWDKIDAAFKELNEKIDEIWDWGKETLYGRLKTKIVAAWRLLDKKTQKVLEDLNTRVSIPLTKQIDKAYNGLSKMLFAVAKIGLFIGIAVAKAMKAGISMLKDSMTSSEFIEKIVDTFVQNDKISGLFKLTEQMTKIEENINETFSDMSNVIAELKQSIIDSLNLVSTKIDDMHGVLFDFISNFQETFYTISTKIDDMHGVLFDFISNFQETVDTVTAKIDEVIQKIFTRIDLARDDIEGLSEQIDDLSESKISKIADTSKTWFGEAANKIGNMFKQDQQMADQIEQQKEEEKKRQKKNDPMDDRFKLLYQFLATHFGAVMEKLEDTNETIVNMVSEDAGFDSIKDF